MTTNEEGAALAAIERVRALFPEATDPCPPRSCTHVDCEVINALDGAPEPEWEWTIRSPGDDEPFSDVYGSREHLAACVTGIAWGEEELVRRRAAGAWEAIANEGVKP